MSNKELPSGTAAEKTTEAAVPTSSPTIGNTPVISRFYCRTESGLAEIKPIRSWNYMERILVLHEGSKEKWTVSDYLTGMLITTHKFKTEAIRSAERIISTVPEKQMAGKFSWNKYPVVNSPDFISGFNELNELLKRDGQFKEGVLLAMKYSQNGL